jgi:hypothetical protein
MLVLAYKNFSISVDSIPDSFNDEFFNPTVKITSDDRTRLSTLISTRAFAVKADAEAFGLQLAKDWVDRER